MNPRFYPDTDSLYIDLSDEPSVESQEVTPGVILDYDESGHICGIDVDTISKNYMNLFTTSAGLVTMRPAQAGDVDDVLAILTEAGKWLASKGIDQWRPDQFKRDGIAAAIERGEAYVAMIDGDIVGTLRLQWVEEALWNARPGNAGYVHKLAVKRSHAGSLIGSGMLQWAERQVASNGGSFLRLDCMAGNSALRNYYLEAGFTLVGEAQMYGFNAALFEREVKAINIECYLMSESTLAKDWLRPEEDKAWKHL